MTTVLDAGVDELAPIVGRKRACEVLGRSRASHYRARQGPRHRPAKPRHSPRALSPDEADTEIATLNNERFCEAFLACYNNEHRHSGIGYNTWINQPDEKPATI